MNTEQQKQSKGSQGLRGCRTEGVWGHEEQASAHQLVLIAAGGFNGVEDGCRR